MNLFLHLVLKVEASFGVTLNSSSIFQTVKSINVCIKVFLANWTYIVGNVSIKVFPFIYGVLKQALYIVMGNDCSNCFISSFSFFYINGKLQLAPT